MLLRLMRLVVGVALIALALYGWKVLDMNGSVAFLLGAIGVAAMLGAVSNGLPDID